MAPAKRTPRTPPKSTNPAKPTARRDAGGRFAPAPRRDRFGRFVAPRAARVRVPAPVREAGGRFAPREVYEARAAERAHVAEIATYRQDAGGRWHDARGRVLPKASWPTTAAPPRGGRPGIPATPAPAPGSYAANMAKAIADARAKERWARVQADAAHEEALRLEAQAARRQAEQEARAAARQAREAGRAAPLPPPRAPREKEWQGPRGVPPVYNMEGLAEELGDLAGTPWVADVSPGGYPRVHTTGTIKAPGAGVPHGDAARALQRWWRSLPADHALRHADALQINAHYADGRGRTGEWATSMIETPDLAFAMAVNRLDDMAERYEDGETVAFLIYTFNAEDYTITKVEV
jgi:hypothetical protein